MKFITLSAFTIFTFTSVYVLNFLGCLPNKQLSNLPVISEKPSNSTSKNQDDWKTATFKGLVMGSSNQTDALKVLGKPNWQGFPEGDSEKDESPEWWMDYNVIKEDSWKGKLTVVLDYNKKTILAIHFYPEKMYIDDITTYLGSNYSIKKYSFEPCYDESDSAPLYEDSNGNITYLEYREKGIAVYFDSDKNLKNIQGILYLSKPLGAKTSQCKN